jgi:hypothetical protein
MQDNFEDFEDEDFHAAIHALVAWFKSQGIKPVDSVPIMAVVMAWACASMVDDSKADATGRLEEAIKRASALLPTAAKFIGTGGLKSKH